MPRIKTIAQRYHVWITLLFLYALLASVAIYKGSVQSPDTASFINGANLLVNHKFNFFSFFSSGDSAASGYSVSKPFFYIFPINIIDVLKSIFSEQWIPAFQASNLAALFFVLFFYAKIALHFNIRKWLTSASLLIFLVSVDFLLWPRHILTDTLFASLVMLAIYAVITRNHDHFRSYIICDNSFTIHTTFNTTLYHRNFILSSSALIGSSDSINKNAPSLSDFLL